MPGLGDKVAPTREERLGATIEYGGTVGEIDQAFQSGCLRHRARGFSQGSICQLMPATAILTSILNSVVIVHGAIGCGSAIHAQGSTMRLGQWAAGDPNPRGALWLSTNFRETDVVSGGEAKLRAAVLEADRRYRPELIIILSACISGIIGDDIDTLALEMKSQVRAVLLPIHCEGFKTKIMATAYDAIFHSVLRNLIDGEDPVSYGLYRAEEREALERLRRGRLVNMLNVSAMTGPDQRELIRLLSKLGLEVNMLPCDASAEAFRLAPLAALSVGVCPTHDDYFLEHLKERYGVPYVSGQMPIGIENTSIWLRQAGAALGLGKEAEGIIESEEKELRDSLRPILPSLAGKTAMLSAGEIRTLSTALLLGELGMEIACVRPYHYDRFGAPEIERLARLNPGLRINVATAQPFEAVNIIRRIKPDIYIGHNSDTVWAAKCGIPVLPIYGAASCYSGYAGAYDVARRLRRHFGNNSFNRKLSRFARQPYRESWYGRDPYSYIKEGL
jgi:nitrogenase molybdenum-iron protein alpha chain